MLQASDSVISTTNFSRAEWLALLARAPLDLLEQVLKDHTQEAPLWLRPPETGLMMVEGRAGGTGERFNLGEVTVTRCALRLPNAQKVDPVGIAYVVGRSHRHAYLAAIADALLLSDAWQDHLKQSLLAPIKELVAQQNSARQTYANSSKVDFFTVARESGAGQDDED